VAIAPERRVGERTQTTTMATPIKRPDDARLEFLKLLMAEVFAFVSTVAITVAFYPIAIFIIYFDGLKYVVGG